MRTAGGRRAQCADAHEGQVSRIATPVIREAWLQRFLGRGGDRIAIASYLGKGGAFDRAPADFAVPYADQNERDYEAFAVAVNVGRLDAQTSM